MAYAESNDYLRISARSCINAMGALQFLLMELLMVTSSNDFFSEDTLDYF